MVKVTPEMQDAYCAWEPPFALPDTSKPARLLGVLRAAFYAGWMARQPQPAQDDTQALRQEVERLRGALWQARDNLHTGAKMHCCPALHKAAETARQALKGAEG